MARYDFRTQRLYFNQPLGAGGQVSPDRAQSNYILNVLRMKENDPLLVFNGEDGEWLAHVRPNGRKSCLLALERQVRDQTRYGDLKYLFAPLKSGRLDYMVQKAVEMGVGTLCPVITQHTQVSKPKLDRIRANAIEAAEQCGILSIPSVEDACSLEASISCWDPQRKLVYCDEHDGGEKIRDWKNGGDPPGGVLIGPEGGFSKTERDWLRSLEFVVPISLGPRILRADTAAVAALTIVQAAIEGW